MQGLERFQNNTTLLIGIARIYEVSALRNYELQVTYLLNY